MARRMVNGTLDAASFQEPLIIAGLVLAGAGAILWFGAFTLADDDQIGLRRFATALSLLSPVCLAWPILMEIGTVALWLLLGFFGALLVGVILANWLLPRFWPFISRFRFFIPRLLPGRKKGTQEGNSQRGETKTNAIPDRVSEGSEQHILRVKASTLTASDKSLANASVLIAVGLTLFLKGLHALRTAVIKQN